MQLRYLQTLTEIGAEQNSTIVFPMPIDIIKPFLDLMEKTGKPAGINGDARLPLTKKCPVSLVRNPAHMMGCNRQTSDARSRAR